MTLEIRTEYDIPHLEELQRVLSVTNNPGAARKSRKKFMMLGAAMLVCGAVLLMISEKPLVSSAAMAVLGGIMLSRGVNFYKHAAKSIRRKMNRAFTGNDYILDELGIRVDNCTGTLEYSYENVDRLLETPGNIYVMLDDGQGLILDKSRVSGGSAEELRGWLQDNTGKQLEQVDLSDKAEKAAAAAEKAAKK